MNPPPNEETIEGIALRVIESDTLTGEVIDTNTLALEPLPGGGTQQPVRFTTTGRPPELTTISVQVDNPASAAGRVRVTGKFVVFEPRRVGM